MKEHSIQSKISFYLSLKLFSKRLPFFYCLFNYFFDKFKNKNNLNKDLNNFEKNGFAKLNYNFVEEVNIIQNKLGKTKKINQARENYEINLNDKIYFSDIIIKKLKPFFLDLENYYNSKPVIVDLNIYMNHFFNKDDINDNKDLIAESFHNDGYISNYFKIHINFEDVNLNKGPMKLIKKSFNKEFRNDISYEGRFSYKEKRILDKDYLYINTGKKGDALMFDPTTVFHRASIPKKNFTRTMMEVILYIPTKKIEDENQIFNYNKKYISFTKPHTIRKLISFLIKYKSLSLRKN